MNEHHNDEAVEPEIAQQEPVEAVEGEVIVDAAKTSDEDNISPDAQLKQLEEQVAEYRAGWQRAVAELDNFRKRTNRERDHWRATLNEEFLGRILPVVDDFDLAAANLPDDLAGHDWANGVMAIHRKLITQLADMGVTEIEALGKPFDPNLHEAIMTAPSEAYDSGIVFDVLRKGYQVGERIIRPALVRVAD